MELLLPPGPPLPGVYTLSCPHQALLCLHDCWHLQETSPQHGPPRV